MVKKFLLTFCGVLLLSGCGAGKDVTDAATAPVDNIKNNIDYMQDTKKELQGTANKRADQTNKQIDDILKKK